VTTGPTDDLHVPVVAISAPTKATGQKYNIFGTSDVAGGTATVELYAGTSASGSPIETFTVTTSGSGSAYTWSVARPPS
jgi:hypothetical protein